MGLLKTRCKTNGLVCNFFRRSSLEDQKTLSVKQIICHKFRDKLIYIT